MGLGDKGSKRMKSLEECRKTHVQSKYNENVTNLEILIINYRILNYHNLMFYIKSLFSV